MPLITLLTDFGSRDEYAGVMKGVIAGIHPAARIVDITHHIDPQDVVHGAFILAAAYRFFPSGSVHVAVVDPGVGGGRRIVAVEGRGYRFLAPDNGLLERVLADLPSATVVAVENPRYFLHPVSRSFHGRDIFAPVAARLADGLPVTELGPTLERRSLVGGVVPDWRILEGGRLEGAVVAADRFGNLMTNIDAAAITRMEAIGSGGDLKVEVGGRAVGGIVTAYEKVPRQALLAIVGSRGLLEISVNCGNAQERLGAVKGDRVIVYPF